MKKFLLSMSLCLTASLVVAMNTQACDPRPGCGSSARPAGVRPTPAAPVKPASGVVAPAQQGQSVNPGNDDVVWDLPAAEKQRIKQAVRLREDAPAPSQAAPTTATTPQADGRLANAIAAHKALAAQLGRLSAKRAQVQRWDAQAQEKFRQAFGSTDEQVRKAVLQRIDQQIQESSRLLTALADNIRFDFYVSRDKQRQ